MGLSIWLGGNMIVALVAFVTVFNLPKPWAIALLLAQITLLVIPLDVQPPDSIRRFLAFSVSAAQNYFPIHVEYEDQRAFKAGTSYLIGYEPHSVLPLGMCLFTQLAQDTPPPLRGFVMGTSTVFLAPVMRHMCWWLGLRPVSRKEILNTLRRGVSCALCPGGVQEVLYMQEGKEVVFLRKRRGFVRLALQTGSPLVPVFAFGQTPHYTYSRPFIDWPKKVVPTSAHPISRLARQIGYLPMVAWGWMGTAMPRRVPMHVVVGPPLKVPHVEDPPPAMVDDYLGKFIAEVERMFREHKAKAGHPQEQLVV